jgi:hypothetical protein
MEELTLIGYMPNTLQGLLSWSPCGVLDSKQTKEKNEMQRM